MSDTKTKSVPKLSVKPPGVWRNHYIASGKLRDPQTGEVFGPEWLGEIRHPSAEIAEQRALDLLAKWPNSVRIRNIRYLGPVHFPEDAT
jgi:hypothetical protein